MHRWMVGQTFSMWFLLHINTLLHFITVQDLKNEYTIVINYIVKI